MSWIRTLLSARLVTPLCSQAAFAKLTNALAYPKFALDENEIRSLLDEYLPNVETVDVGEPTGELPQRRDPDDQMVLELAHTGNADVLVTGDDYRLSGPLRRRGPRALVAGTPRDIGLDCGPSARAPTPSCGRRRSSTTDRPAAFETAVPSTGEKVGPTPT